MHRVIFLVILLIIILFWSIWCCLGVHPVNSPHPGDPIDANTLYSGFRVKPKHLDPARSYSSYEWRYLAQIYESPLSYKYATIPLKLEPSLAQKLPEITYQRDPDTKKILSTEYKITIKSGVYYQNHPCFVAENRQLSKQQARRLSQLKHLKQTGTREVTAEDFILQIKRLAHPELSSPIFGFMDDKIIGLNQFRQFIKSNQLNEAELVDYDLSGIEQIDKYTYVIKIMGNYPQFKYWLAMPFFSPIPVEALQFYQQPGLENNNITLDWYPVGTGAYILQENNPDRQISLVLNSNYRESNQDFIGEINVALELETIPYWNKFLQGYYDSSGISSDNLEHATDFSPQTGLQLSEELNSQDIKLHTMEAPSIYFWGVNMLDPVIGGYTDRSRTIRQAISQVFNTQEYINIFLNGRGNVTNIPIPKGIFGNKESKPLELDTKKALQLLKDIGIVDGLDLNTGKPFTLYYDTSSTGSPQEKLVFQWLVKQFAKLNIQLIVRATTPSQFRDKMQQGRAQLYSWGWNADYPDPENFLFLLYGENGKAKYGGENASNYINPEYDLLFEKMQVLPNTLERQEIIDKMLEIVHTDKPWFALHTVVNYKLVHGWIDPGFENGIVPTEYKNRRLDHKLRAQKIIEWNKPILLPLWLLLGLITALVLIICWFYYHKLQVKVKRCGIT